MITSRPFEACLGQKRYSLIDRFLYFRSLIIMNIIVQLIFFLITPIIHSLPSNSYYLIDIDSKISSNTSYCSNLLTNEQTYRIPSQCRHHLLCTPYYCDEQSFRCMKIRESLCCLYRYLQDNCREVDSNQIRDLFRSIYFQISIEHGYCEINLERIEKNDQAYCIATVEEETTATTTVASVSIRPSYRHFHRRPSTLSPTRYRPRLAVRQNYSSLANLDYLRRFTIIEANIASKSPKILLDLLLILSGLFSILS